MRLVRVALCCTLAWTAAIAQIAKLPEPYQSLAELARGAPPEFTADALLRIVEQGRLRDRDVKFALVEEAFRSAAAAKFPVRMHGLPGTTTDTASGSLSRAYELKLDALSLQSRAVRDMLPLDPAAARKLFAEIVRPMLSPLTCDDALVYDLPDFYQALGAIVNGAFTQKERAKEDHLTFLSDYLGQAASPLELAPLAQVVQSIGGTAQQRQGLMARLGGLLETMPMDDRSFSASLPTFNALSIPELQPSLEKFRQRGHLCEGDPGTAKTPSTPKLDSYWQSGASQQLLKLGKNLRNAPNGTPLTDADRATPAWQQQVNDFLNQIAGWSADQENSSADYYHEKCIVFLALIELVPPGPQNDKLVADYVDFVGNSKLYQESPVEWFQEPRALLDRFQPGTVMRGKILDAYDRSGNPILNLEVALERTFSRTRILTSGVSAAISQK